MVILTTGGRRSWATAPPELHAISSAEQHKTQFLQVAQHLLLLTSIFLALVSALPGLTNSCLSPCVCSFAYGTASPDQDATAEDDDDANSVSSDWSNMSDENKAAPPQAQTNVTDATTTGGSDFEADGESSNDMDLIDDSDIRNAVEDFDSRNWTMEQLEVSCQTLLEECYASEDRRRRLLSAGMLLKLVETYPSALRWVQIFGCPVSSRNASYSFFVGSRSLGTAIQARRVGQAT